MSHSTGRIRLPTPTCCLIPLVASVSPSPHVVSLPGRIRLPIPTCCLIPLVASVSPPRHVVSFHWSHPTPRPDMLSHPLVASVSPSRHVVCRCPPLQCDPTVSSSFFPRIRGVLSPIYVTVNANIALLVTERKTPPPQEKTTCLQRCRFLQYPMASSQDLVGT